MPTPANPKDSVDRYAELREALEAGPTPGPRRVDDRAKTAVRGPATKETPDGFVIITCGGWVAGSRDVTREQEANAQLAAACAPDTIRFLLAERDALLAELVKAREALNVIASWPEGPEVTPSFDDPPSARTARNALAALILLEQGT